MLLWTSLAVFSAAFFYAGVPLIHSRLARLMLKQKAKKLNSLVLTFDDGPGSRLTPAILRILSEHRAKATFFLLGRNVVGHRQIVRQIFDEGHEICSHGYNHVDYLKALPMRTIKDIKQGWQAIDAALGINHNKYAFRPPRGRLNIVSLLYLLFCRVPIVYWSVDLGDTWLETIDPHRIAHLAKEAGGAVSLAHDFDRSDDTADSLILESVRSALTMAQQTGMQVLTCSQLFSRGKKGN